MLEAIRAEARLFDLCQQYGEQMHELRLTPQPIPESTELRVAQLLSEIAEFVETFPHVALMFEFDEDRIAADRKQIDRLAGTRVFSK